MLPKQLAENLEKGRIAPVYLFLGEADFLIEEAWRLLLEKVVPPKARRFNGERLSAKEFTAAQVIGRLKTIPMFGPKQLLLLRHAEAWPKDQRSLLFDYAANPCPTACLVVVSSQRKGFEKLEEALKAEGAVVHFRPPGERDIPRWLQERAGMRGKTLGSPAAQLLLELVGADLHRLERELEKLVVYVGERARIEREDVEQAVSSQRSYSVFEFLRYVSGRRTAQAVDALRNLMISGEAPLAVLALIARQVRHLWQVKDAMERGAPISQIAGKLGIPQFVVEKHAEQSRLLTESRLRQIHEALREADIKLKSTGSAPDLILENLALALCLEK